jgi:hypothetical protein
MRLCALCEIHFDRNLGKTRQDLRSQFNAAPWLPMVAVQASDRRGASTEQSFSINVPAASTPNRAPQITSTAPGSVLMAKHINTTSMQRMLTATHHLCSVAGARGGEHDQFVGRLVWTPNPSQGAAQFSSSKHRMAKVVKLLNRSLSTCSLHRKRRLPQRFRPALLVARWLRINGAIHRTLWLK